MLSSVPRWARVSAAVLAVGIGSEVLYEVYSICMSAFARRRARRRALCQLTEVYFANERSCQANEPGTTMTSFTTEHVRRLVALLDRARVSVNLCMYIVTVDSIGDAVLRAAKRGVRVCVVGCSSMAYSSGSQMTRLVQAGIPVRFNKKDAAYLMHHKFCLIDTDWLCARCYHSERVRKSGFCCGVPSPLPAAPAASVANGGGGGNGSGTVSPTAGSSKVPCVDDGSRCVRCDPKKKKDVEERKLREAATEPFPLGGIVISGSTNWTMQALSSNWDNMVLTSLPELVVPFQMEFQRLWKEFGRLRPLMAEVAPPAATGGTASGQQP
ncbi:mitochondrial cardiolipin hydrolase [Sabethes cyaneus]|uniref:mitochondrial cardiolipin hydrolase n=1 Tax=Sabethes cyaneus TaxID=53552 RepID=UPI00221E354B|nr:mitochondrial cardiolipin hydrolase [Sabethes cyaneus]